MARPHLPMWLLPHLPRARAATRRRPLRRPQPPRLRAAALGGGHPDVARDLNALGALYHLAGRYRDAAHAYQRSLVIFENCYGPEGFEVAQACASLSVL